MKDLVSVSGQKFEDSNGNDVRDAGDESNANNLVPSDQNNIQDVFVHGRGGSGSYVVTRPEGRSMGQVSAKLPEDRKGSFMTDAIGDSIAPPGG